MAIIIILYLLLVLLNNIKYDILAANEITQNDLNVRA